MRRYRTAGRFGCLSLLAPLVLSACDSRPSRIDPTDVAVVVLPQPERPPEPRRSMSWIPPGAFVAGTPADRIPRIPNEEMPGVLVVMHGFHVDQYPDPNEPGAIQSTNMTRDDAQQKCVSLGKRLCTELEWERACKGPQSTTYEYGDVYRVEECLPETRGVLAPTGMRVGCKSAFGVHDMHGGAFEWTASPWGRGSSRPWVALRGGSGSAGDVVSRCANAVPRSGDARAADIGFRCCAGEPNDAEVGVEVTHHAQPLVWVPSTSRLVSIVEQSLPEDTVREFVQEGPGAFKTTRHWTWYPVDNEELFVALGCGRRQAHSVCGVVVSRIRADKAQPLGFVSTGSQVPIIKIDDDSRTIWLFGIDEKGNYRRRVAYLWGRIGVGEPERKIPKKRARP